MPDSLVKLAKNPIARKIVPALGLPIPLPQELRRRPGPWIEHPLEGRRFLVAGTGGLAGLPGKILANAGAEITDLSRGDNDDGSFDGLVFDATGLDNPEDLGQLHEFFHPRIRRLATCGRVIVLGRAPDQAASGPAAAAAAALDGFVRSVAREVGRRGGTAHLLVVENGAENRFAGPLRFLASDRSAFVTGQPLRISATVAQPASLPAIQPLEGKVAVVTGAARGIGAQVLRRLAEEGATVVGIDRPEDGELLGTTCAAHGGTAFPGDVTDPDLPTRLRDFLADQFDGVDIVVHNAGVTRDRTLGKMERGLWDSAVDINLGSVVRINEALLESGLRDHGRIICLSSVAGIAGNVGQTNYAASKAGLIGLVRSMAPDLAERGVTFNAIAPGFIETRLTAAIPFFTREGGRRLCSLGQGGEPVDVAEAITFLASPGSFGMSGSVLRVCGGALLGA